MIAVQSLSNRSTVDNRYNLTDTHIDDYVSPGRRRYGLWKAPAITSLPELKLAEENYDRYTVTSADIGRIDLIAWNFYKDVSMWWVIAVYNNIANPFDDLVVGNVLLIPKKEDVVKAMEERKTYI